ncbi:MAG: methyltransferase domain-containing protein [Candidatus Sericytochromatia bacterium]|nr:methyltransferase domain-containing protein [Candidatus Sericytochromatia bacterium]
MADSFLTFISEIIRKPGEVGAVAPSSKYLGIEISNYVKSPSEPINVIEVGPGTGAFTKIIADKLKPKDRLDVIEFNSEFVKVLKEKMKDYPNVFVHCLSITDWKPDYKYDYMVSSLPFNVFDDSFVKVILNHYEDIMKPNSMISYFEYMLFPKLKKMLLSGTKKENFLKLHQVLDDFRHKYEIDTKKVFINFPPAYVHNLKLSS